MQQSDQAGRSRLPCSGVSEVTFALSLKNKQILLFYRLLRDQIRDSSRDYLRERSVTDPPPPPPR